MKILSFNQYLNENKLNIDDNIIDFLENKNIFIDNYISSGTKGTIYSLKNGNVLKISSHNVESQYLDYSEMIGKINEHLVNIYDCFKYNNHIFIEMEKLIPIKYNMWKKFDNENSEEQLISESFLSFLNYENNKKDFENTKEDFLKIQNKDFSEMAYTPDYIIPTDIDDDDIESILDDLDIMFDAQMELDEKYGLYLHDFHSENIMEGIDDYKIIDFI